MKISYYAVFNYQEYDDKEEKDGIAITFPDVPAANSCARNESEAMAMALDVLQLLLIGDDGHWPTREELPNPTPLEKIRFGPCEKAVLIQFDTDQVDLSQFKFFEGREET